MLPFDEEKSYLAIKTVAEYFYCQRAAFYMVINWENNMESKYFYKGMEQHQVIDEALYKHRPFSKLLYRYPVVNNKLKIYGICDVISENKNSLVFPIEYKTGKIRENIMHSVQLCLQALCLEEMHGYKIPFGYIYFIESHKRQKVSLSKKLRTFTIAGLKEFRKKLTKPDVKNFKSCGNIFCSYHQIDNPVIYQT